MQQARMKEVANHYSRRGFYIKVRGLEAYVIVNGNMQSKQAGQFSAH